jgi:hypothetical protein
MAVLPPVSLRCPACNRQTLQPDVCAMCLHALPEVPRDRGLIMRHRAVQRQMLGF